MEELKLNIANQVGAFERGGAKDTVSRNIQESFKKHGHDVELLKIRQEFDKNIDAYQLRSNILNLAKGE